MEYKIGDKVTIKRLGSVWTIRFIDGQAYFVSQGKKSMWANECGIEPAPPRESRKELKKRIKELEEQLQVTENMPLPVKDRQIEELQKQVEEMEQYKHHVNILQSRIELSEKQKTRLKEKLAKAEEAIEIVEALERMPLGCGVWRTVVTNKWAYSKYLNGRDATEYYTTIKDALQAAGLMEEKEEQR